MTGRRALAAGLSAALGVALLVAAAVVGGGDEEPPVASAPPPPAATSEPARVGPGRVLERSRPRPGDAPGTSGPSGGAPSAATGRRLPRQWPDFRPTALSLGAAAYGATAPVEPVSVVGRALELPADADRVGWWRGGARAGTPYGTVVVAGHLDTTTDPAGYLVALTALRPGDRVVLSAPRRRQAYEVVRNYLLPSADLSARSDLFEQRRPHRLLLVTCGGPYDRVRGRYLDNRVVEAVPVAAPR
ncbi:hypothetical protein GCM10009623_27900 [Nocardioides aestuarii]|uniref:Class F sortase n=1 Tax=Nocardioides aestuarii TaxID=252231 RepID=A0ABW4TN95_9ACTN